MLMEIKSLVHTDFDTLFNAFEQAFAEYELQLNSAQLAKMLQRRGFDPRLSFAAFDRGRIAAFTLNGIGSHNGLRTAYDTGTGTLKEYRGKGLATEIFNHSIPRLKAAGIEQYLLEVLQHNTTAVSVYRNLGFEVTREFNYSVARKDEIDIRTAKPAPACSIRRITPGEYGAIYGFQDFQPSWQNSPESLRRASGELAARSAFLADRLIGGCILEPASGDIPLLAVDKDYRRRGVGSLLLRQAVGLVEADIIKVTNTDTACEAVTRFLKAQNIPIRGKQFEMIRKFNKIL